MSAGVNQLFEYRCTCGFRTLHANEGTSMTCPRCAGIAVRVGSREPDDLPRDDPAAAIEPAGDDDRFRDLVERLSRVEACAHRPVPVASPADVDAVRAGLDSSARRSFHDPQKGTSTMNARAPVIVVAALALPALAHAQDVKETGLHVTFAWSAPIERLDGSPLEADELEAYAVTCDGAELGQVPGDALELEADVTPGAHTCTVAVIDTEGRRSPESDAVNFMAVPASPRAPGGLSVRSSGG